MSRIFKTAVVAMSVISFAGLCNVANAKPGHGNGSGQGNGHHTGKPTSGRASLAVPQGSAGTESGVMDVRDFPAHGHQAERFWLRFKLRSLTAAASYTLWMDDPASLTQPNLTQVPSVTLTADSDGSVNLRFDTKHAGPLPFGATLAQLAGTAAEIRDATGTATVLAGVVPAAK